MTLVRYNARNFLNPWDRLSDLERQFNHMWSGAPATTGTIAQESWVPAIDIHDAGEEYVFEADMPGMKKEDIDITVADNVLTIKGERKREHKEGGEKNGYFRYEREYGTFERSFELPAGIDSEKVNADFKDGVLKITLPKSEGVKPRRIEVKQN